MSEILQLTAAKQDFIRAVKEGVSPDLLQVLKRWEIMLQKLAADTATLSVAQAASAEATKSMVELLRLAGLDEWQQKLETSYIKVASKAAEAVKAGGIPVSARTLDENALSAVAKMRTRQVARTVTKAVDQVQEAWVQSTFGGTPIKEGLQRAAKAVQDVTPQQAKTQVGTALNAIDVDVTGSLSEDRGDDTVFLYIGPSDGVTRLSCSKILGKWGT
ncbi:MAG: hypothetical protein DRI61_09680, partial [Chloroflexi bacterium]